MTKNSQTPDLTITLKKVNVTVLADGKLLRSKSNGRI